MLQTILFTDIVGSTELAHAIGDARWRSLLERHDATIRDALARHDGSEVNTAGDGFVATFDAPTQALACASAVQDGLQDLDIEVRAGVHTGEVEGDRRNPGGIALHIGARIAAEAKGGEILASGTVRDLTTGSGFSFESAGTRTLKGLPGEWELWRLTATVDSGEPHESDEPETAHEQKIRFCTAIDGARIAYATVGQGPPIVKTANWLNHLEFDWESPAWRHVIRELSRGRTLIRYDERGNGLSDWDVDELSFEAFVHDLEAVVDATGLERFPLFGISQGCAVSIAYAVRHPERVSRLVLHGGYAVGWRVREDPEGWREGMLDMIREGWGQESPAFRQMFASMYIPEGSPEQLAWLTELQRVSTSPENAVRLLDVLGNIDVRDLLPRVKAPTLVLHSRGDVGVPFENGRALAHRIPDARFVALDSRNHLVQEQEPAWPRFVEVVRGFLDEA